MAYSLKIEIPVNDEICSMKHKYQSQIKLHVIERGVDIPSKKITLARTNSRWKMGSSNNYSQFPYSFPRFTTVQKFQRVIFVLITKS